MPHVIALARTSLSQRFDAIEAMRALIVCGCALALIAAG